MKKLEEKLAREVAEKEKLRLKEIEAMKKVSRSYVKTVFTQYSPRVYFLFFKQMS